MQADKGIAEQTAKVFAGHTMADHPSKSWMVCGKSSAYHFVITWTPGTLFVSGDLGGSAYSSHGFGTLDGTLEIVGHGCFEYLTSKSTHALKYDPVATAKGIIRDAYYYFRQGVSEPMERIIDECRHGDVDNSSDRKEACRALMSAAETDDLSEQTAYDLSTDSEVFCQKYGVDANWHFQALQEWAQLLAGVDRQMRASAARSAA